MAVDPYNRNKPRDPYAGPSMDFGAMAARTAHDLFTRADPYAGTSVDFGAMAARTAHDLFTRADPAPTRADPQKVRGGKPYSEQAPLTPEQKEAQRRGRVNATFERMRQAYADTPTDYAGFSGGGAQPQSGYQSLASSLDKNGVPTFDNRSIQRMIARDAGPGGFRDMSLNDVNAFTGIQRRGFGLPRGGGDGAAAAPSYGNDNVGYYAPQAQAASRRGIAAQQKRIDDAIWEMGRANTPSKRALLGSLLERRAALEQNAYDKETGINAQNAELGAKALSESADLREKGLARRQQAAQFAQEFGLRSRGQDSLASLVDAYAKDAEAKRKAQSFAYGAAGERDKTGNEYVDRLTEGFEGGGVPFAVANREAQKQYAADNIAARGELPDDNQAYVGAHAAKEDAAYALSKGQGFGSWLADGAALGASPLFNSTVATDDLNPDEVRTGRRGWLVPAYNWIMPDSLNTDPYYAQVPGTGLSTTLDEAAHKQMLRDLRIAKGAKRRE